MKEKEHVLISQFSTKYFATNFRSFLKNCYNYFRLLFQKNPFGCWRIFSWLLNLTILGVFLTIFDTLGCSETIPMAADEIATWCTYMSLVVECMYSG